MKERLVLTIVLLAVIVGGAATHGHLWGNQAPEYSGNITGWKTSEETNYGDGKKKVERIIRCRNEQYNVEWAQVNYPTDPAQHSEQCVYKAYLKGNRL